MARISRSSSGGSVNIQDSDGNPITSTGGALDVNVETGGTPLTSYNEVTGVAMGASAAVLTYTVLPGQTLSISRVLISSDSISTIELQIDSVTQAKARLCYTNYNLTLDYPDSLAAGTVITVTATNNSNQGTASFNATLLGTTV